MTRVILYYTLTEFGPVFAFFIAAQLFSFFIATGVFVVTTVAAIAITWISNRRLPVFPLVSGSFVLIAGVITIVYRAPDALILSDSVYYFLASAIIGIGMLKNKLILKKLFGFFLAIDDTGWKILSVRFMYLCLFAGILNEVVRIGMSIDFWVHYKFVKMFFIAFFVLYQFKVTQKYRTEGDSNCLGVRKSLFVNHPQLKL